LRTNRRDETKSENQKTEETAGVEAGDNTVAPSNTTASVENLNASGNVTPTARSGLAPGVDVQEVDFDAALVNEDDEEEKPRGHLHLVTDSTGKLIRVEGTNV